MSQLRASRRELRKAVGPRAADTIADVAINQLTFHKFLRRGLLGWNVQVIGRCPGAVYVQTFCSSGFPVTFM